jgi:hypothetical protein
MLLKSTRAQRKFLNLKMGSGPSFDRPMERRADGLIGRRQRWAFCTTLPDLTGNTT